MFNKDKIKGFIAGVVSAVTIAGAVVAFAAASDVVFCGIKVYLDGIEKTLIAADGNVIEPMLYKGNTYVPLRAMANLMGAEVDWEHSTKSVFIGGKPVAQSTPLEAFAQNRVVDYFQIKTGNEAVFQLKDDSILCDNLLLLDYHTDGTVKPKSNLYKLNGDYTTLLAQAVMPWTVVGSDGKNVVIFNSVADDGSKEELARFELKQTEDPFEIEIDLTGVINLEIQWNDLTDKGDLKYSTDSIALYNLYLLAE